MTKGKIMGPCLCGDICCPYCGPAQGNVRCEVCGRWASDGGCVDPEACERTIQGWIEEDEREMLDDMIEAEQREMKEQAEREEIMEDMRQSDLS